MYGRLLQAQSICDHVRGIAEVVEKTIFETSPQTSPPLY